MNDESLKAMDEIMASIRKAVTVGDAPAPAAAPPASWPPAIGAADIDAQDAYEDGTEFEADPIDDGDHAEPAPPIVAAPAPAPPVSGQTLEDFVRAALEPALKIWLDANLPEIVDARVQAEIGRLTKS